MLDLQDFNLEVEGEMDVPYTHPSHRPRPVNESPNINSKKNTKAAIRIATLNIRGYRNNSAPRSETKWNHINQVVRDRKIGILLVQESHLSNERKEEVEKLFGRRMKILHSTDPDNPTGKGGIAVMLNRNLLNMQGAEL